MADIRLRVAFPTAADAEKIAQFQVDMAMESEGLALDPPTVLSGVKALIADPSRGHYFVAYDDNAPEAGIIACLLVTKEWSDWHNAEYWWFQSVYVVPDYRRQRVFSSMVMHVEDLARRNHVKSLRLYVDQDNAPAKATYSSLGLDICHYQICEKVLM